MMDATQVYVIHVMVVDGSLTHMLSCAQFINRD